MEGLSAVTAPNTDPFAPRDRMVDELGQLSDPYIAAATGKLNEVTL